MLLGQVVDANARLSFAEKILFYLQNLYDECQTGAVSELLI